MSNAPQVKWTSTNRTSITNTVANVRLGQTQLFGWIINNVNASDVYLQFFNLAVADVTLGTTPPTHVLKFPANTATVYFFENVGVYFSVAMTIAATTTETGSTAPGSALSVDLFYQ